MTTLRTPKAEPGQRNTSVTPGPVMLRATARTFMPRQGSSRRPRPRRFSRRDAGNGAQRRTPPAAAAGQASEPPPPQRCCRQNCPPLRPARQVTLCRPAPCRQRFSLRYHRRVAAARPSACEAASRLRGHGKAPTPLPPANAGDAVVRSKTAGAATLRVEDSFVTTVMLT